MPPEYLRNVAGGIYRLIEDGRLDPSSAGISDFLASNIPEFFGAVTGNLGFGGENVKPESTQQEKIFQILAHMGASGKIRGAIDGKHKKINAFSRMGSEWKSRIGSLIAVLKSKEISIVDKSVAYGALFYLLTPFDLIPDAVPVVGYIDDFAMLGFAMAYYARMHHNLLPAKSKRLS